MKNTNHGVSRSNYHDILPFTIVVLLIFGLSHWSFAQTSLEQIQLEPGEYTVGFQHYTSNDSTRTYTRIYDYSNEVLTRPIPVSIWYPSSQEVKANEPLHILDYLVILKEEEEWEHLPNNFILDWFYYANTDQNKKHLSDKTTAYREIAFSSEKHPVVIYAPSFQASSIENFALCEFLASHGYIVISSPSRGTETRWFSQNRAKEMETQARDVEFLIEEIQKIPSADATNIALIGFSFGGLSNVIVQNRNDHVKAIVSLDGSERYQYSLLTSSPFFSEEKFDVPYLHMAQKDIPELVLKEDNIDSLLNSEFVLYDSLSQSQAYKLKFHDLTHSHFSTLGVLFSNRDSRQDKADAKIMHSYNLVSSYTLHFLNAVINNMPEAFDFVEKQANHEEMGTQLVSVEQKKPLPKMFSFQDFNNLASKQHYKELLTLYETVITLYPSFVISEGDLNTVGLQLVFNPNKSQQGIDVFLLATQLFPNSANLFDSLAEGYLYIGEEEKAIDNFKKSLALNPQNQNAINRLEQLVQ